MLLSQYRPRPKLVTPQHQVESPRFPVIDAHNHLAPPFGGDWEEKPISALLERMDAAGVIHYVDLDGGWGEDILDRHLNLFKARAPDRFSVFGGVDWSQWEHLGNRFPEWAAQRLRIQKERGADGVKIWKNFGLHVRDHTGARVSVDDPRLDPVWQTAGELGMPVLIHVADPVAFFDPIDETNERWEELGKHPDWSFPSPPFPPFLDIVNALHRLVKRHPQVTFIGAHVGCYAENLAWVGKVLDDCPNFYVDIAARLGELGRQPYTARRFFLKYADRILFGTDVGPDLETYRIYYRFLETDDEYFNYNPGEIPWQGRWYIYGIFLPDEVLEKVYAGNARRILRIQG
ncbi:MULTISPECIES: amidohydrolase family protein [Anaerolinea]|uniref:amidohydrolase family protein n=1 Tax=Anaerolinea TaxID=233189 RepID=UPI002609EAA4|nr:amidohydrolase family protein [Anaerolinea thermophila]